MATLLQLHFIFYQTKKERITEKQILETFKESEVLKAFEKLNEEEKNEIFDSIISQTNEEKQIKIIVKYIDKLSKQND